MPDYTDTSRLDLTNEYTIFRWFMRQRASRGREREVNNVVSFSISHKNRPRSSLAIKPYFTTRKKHKKTRISKVNKNLCHIPLWNFVRLFVTFIGKIQSSIGVYFLEIVISSRRHRR